jgi:hypothetical protein
MSRARVIVLGMMGRTPFAGVGWQVLHYLEAFRRAGCDVFYVEDTGSWPYDPQQNIVTDDPTYTVGYIGRLLDWLGLGDRWAYVGPDGSVFGLSRAELERAVESADALVNLTGATLLRDEHLTVPVRMYVETDPVAPQIEVALERPFTIELLEAHTHHFSFGENLGQPDCGIPVGRFDYRPTRQPIVLDWWSPQSRATSANGRFTTVSSWLQRGKDVDWQGETYLWSKHHEFLKVADLPERSARPLELALSHGEAEPGEYQEVVRMLKRRGWRIVDAIELSVNAFSYRDYIVGSRGEFTVAKDQYVRLRSGWFSDRSASYLAAGRPVVTQETGFSKFLPTGEGLFAFETADEALAAMDEIDSDYERHSRAARDLAADCFDARKLAAAMLEEAGV